MAQAANAGSAPVKARKGQIGKYKKWGYIFMLPFILVFLVFQAWPLIQTFYYSMFKYFKSGSGICSADNHFITFCLLVY